MPEVRSKSADTSRLRTHYLESGPEDGIPVVLIHGNLASARFFDQLMAGAPERYRMIAPDMRSFGDSEPKPIDATRGLRDWADDTLALVRALNIERPVHLVGWSTGGEVALALGVRHCRVVRTLTVCGATAGGPTAVPGRRSGPGAHRVVLGVRRPRCQSSNKSAARNPNVMPLPENPVAAN